MIDFTSTWDPNIIKSIILTILLHILLKSDFHIILELKSVYSNCIFNASALDEVDTNNDIISIDEKIKKKLKHTISEQKRRDAIKHGYEELQNIVMPGSSQSSFSKVTLLRNTISYIEYLSTMQQHYEKKINSLKEEIQTLEIFHKYYSSIADIPDGVSDHCSQPVSNSFKLFFFFDIMAFVFKSFSEIIEINSSEDLTRSIVDWVEVFTKSDTLPQFIALYNKMDNFDFN